jgi:hypothetical protein
MDEIKKLKRQIKHYKEWFGDLKGLAHDCVGMNDVMSEQLKEADDAIQQMCERALNYEHIED